MSTQINPTTGPCVDLLGPTIEFLTSPQEENIQFCVLKGVIPPGVSIPIHSHADTEDFFVIAGEVEALRQGPTGYEWVGVKAGDHIHVPGGARHAWRNLSHEPLVAYVITTPKLARFFKEVGRPVAGAAQQPPPGDIGNFLARYENVSAKYGYWNATPEENAAAGIRL